MVADQTSPHLQKKSTRLVGASPYQTTEALYGHHRMYIIKRLAA